MRDGSGGAQGDGKAWEAYGAIPRRMQGSLGGWKGQIQGSLRDWGFLNSTGDP